MIDVFTGFVLRKGREYITSVINIFLLYPGINQFKNDNTMVPIIHTSIIGTMEI